MNPLKKAFYWGLRRESVASTIDSRARGQSAVPQSIPSSFLPTNDLCNHKVSTTREDKNAHLAITARFRSGSTLLWQLFRSATDITAYYEPLNPRRWFDSSHRGTRVDNTHRRVSDYWSEYKSISPASIQWDERWASSDLYLSRLQPEHRLYNYIKLLMDRAPNRSVLQFNRLDFRLEWFSHRFPEVATIHLIRNPRDQWLSTFQKHSVVAPTATIADVRARDEFYLLDWAGDLSRYIPLLADVEDLHPYELSYIIWRLSNVFAVNYVDYSIDYEDLVRTPQDTIRALAARFGLNSLLEPSEVATIDSSSVDRWKNYADSNWFRQRERRCETLLDSFVFHESSQRKNLVSPCIDKSQPPTPNKDGISDV